MALQIGRINASARQILPELNVGKYEVSAKANGRTYYRRKRTYKSEARAAVAAKSGKSRIRLETPGLARRTARQRLGSAISKEDYGSWINKPSDRTGASLKKGIGKMAVKAKLTGAEGTALYRKLDAMDESRLQYLYEKDKLIFDVAFAYDASGEVGANKVQDLEFLVEMYEATFGSIA